MTDKLADLIVCFMCLWCWIAGHLDDKNYMLIRAWTLLKLGTDDKVGVSVF